jgi:hypothetical protein
MFLGISKEEGDRESSGLIWAEVGQMAQGLLNTESVDGKSSYCRRYSQFFYDSSMDHL